MQDKIKKIEEMLKYATMMRMTGKVDIYKEAIELLLKYDDKKRVSEYFKIRQKDFAVTPSQKNFQGATACKEIMKLLR